MKPAGAARGGAFLGDARGRLLPASLPLRWFGAAAGFHVLAWAALLVACTSSARYASGLGWPLAALHLVTLGVLAATAVGASLQLLPVATRQGVRFQRLPAWMWWVYLPAVLALAAGMGTARPEWMATGGGVAIAVLAVFAVLLGLNLKGARGMPGVVGHGWSALAALFLVLFTAAALLSLWAGWPWLGRDAARGMHALAGPYGFMGLLAFGLSYILVPMFTLSATPDVRRQGASLALALVALACAMAAAAGIAPQGLWVLALGSAAGAAALHLGLMRRSLATGMRRDLGRSFVLVRSAWAALPVALLLAAAQQAGLDHPALPALYGITLVPGWLLGFLLGMLQRIAPFLVSMHAAQGRRRAPTPSALTDDRPLAVHQACHFAALALLALGAVLDNRWVAGAGALCGLVGAVAFAVFYGVLLRRWRALAPIPA